MLQEILGRFVKLKISQRGTERKEATGERGRAFLGLFGPLPRDCRRGERLRASSENKWAFYLGEGPREDVLKRLKAEWHGQGKL